MSIGQHYQGSPTYYCPPSPPLDGVDNEFHNESYDIFRMPLRDHISHMLDACRSYGRPDTSIDTGVTGVALILTLATLRVPESFPLDAMHLFYQGVVSRVLVPLFAGKFWKDLPRDSDEDGMQISKLIWSHMGRDLTVILLLHNYLTYLMHLTGWKEDDTVYIWQIS